MAFRKTRAELRGSRLDAACREARTTKHEFGPDDERVFCYGLLDCDGIYADECCECGAFVWNALPPDDCQNPAKEESAEEGGAGGETRDGMAFVQSAWSQPCR